MLPQVAQVAVDSGLVDEVVQVAPPDAIATSKRLAAEEGIFVGVSAGASVFSAIEVCTQLLCA